MSKVSRKLIAFALVGAGAFGAYSLLATPGSDEEAAKAEHLVNQVWLERLPRDERDMIGHLLVLDHPRARVGIAGKSSQWRHFIEGFKWALEGNQLLTVFPQERARAKFRVKTWRCEGDAPHPFELCLQLSRGDRKLVFYSREEWVVEPHDAKASLAELAEDYPELAGVDADLPDAEAARAFSGSDAVDPEAMAEAEPGWLLD